MIAPVHPVRTNPLRALNHRAYRVLWLGALVSNIGTWMETLAVGVHVTETTGKAGWTGTVAALAFVPAVVIGPVAGALADRFERRRYLVLVTLLQAVLAGLLAVLALTNHLSLLAVSVLMVLTGCASAVLNPAFFALLINLVGEDDLTSAMTLNSAQFNLARITGPALAAAILVTWGLPVTLGLNAISFLAVLISVLVVLRQPQHPTGKREALWEGIRTGLDVARRDAGIRGVLVLTFTTALLISPFIGLVPVMAIKIFGRGAHETSMLVTCQGVGAVCSAVLSTAFADAFGRRRLVEGAAWAIAPVAALYWMSPTYGFALPAMALLGATYLSVATGANTVGLSRAPRHAQARISSLFSVVLGGGYGFGLVALGWLGDQFGVRQVAVGACALYLVLLLAQRALLPRFFQAMDEPLPGSELPLPEGSALPPELVAGREAAG